MAVIPNTNVSIATIRDVLNGAGGSVSNDATSFFTANAKINWKSKHKPIIFATNFCQDFDSSRSDYNATWWKGSDGKCGLQVLPLNAVVDLPNAYDGNMNGWSYTLPSGTSSQPMRLGDFCGYDTDAKGPMYNMDVHDMANNSNAEKLAMSIYVMGSGESSVSFLDMDFLNKYYLGVYLLHSNGVNYVSNTSKTPLAAGINSVNINPYGLREGTYTAYPFIAEEPYSQNDPVTANFIYTIPEVNPLTLKVYSESSGNAYVVNFIVVSADIMSIQIKISITNNTSSSATFTNNWVKIRMMGNSFDDPMTSDEYQAALDNITVAANSTVNITHTADIRKYIELQSTGVIYVSLNSANILKSTTYTIDNSGEIM